MVKERVPVVRPGQKFRYKRKKTVYIVKSVKDEAVILISESGESSMRIQMDSLASADFERIYD
jgi:hypothetical protein